MTTRARVLLLIAAIFLLVGAYLLWPLEPREFPSKSEPAHDYPEALRIVDSLRAMDGESIASVCNTTLYTHGHRTSRAIVLLHGLTNCPAQFDSLARMSFARGANVLIPRLPRHGYADRMTTELALVTAKELCAFTDRVIDAAQGLGDSVTVVGLSIGGVLAGWAAQERADVDRAVMIAPIFGVMQAKGTMRRIATRLALAAPNQFVWWDDSAKVNLGGPKHVYPRFSTRSVAATLYVGAITRAQAGRRPPASRSQALVTVGGDGAADNDYARELLRAWREHGATTVYEYEFPAALRLNHDVVDPEQVGGNPALTYPVLTRFIGP